MSHPSILRNPVSRSVLMVFVCTILLVALLWAEINKLSPLYKETTSLVLFVLAFAVSVISGVSIAAIKFFQNRKNPTITVAKAKWLYAIWAVLITAVVFFALTLIFGSTDASCFSSNLYARVDDLLNAQVCLNIKSLIISKMFSFTTPIFIGQMLATTLVAMLWSFVIYLLVTLQVLYKGDI